MCRHKRREPLLRLIVAFSWFLTVLTLAQVSHSHPTINQPQQKTNYVQQLDKTFFQPPELEQTIDEVQKILANDPALPRLTRGEIEELYEKVTREEYEKSIEAGDMSRADSMRALMLVLPYNTDNNTEENLQELYTRPPVTKVIDGYTPHDPIKFLTPDPTSMPHTDAAAAQTKFDATTYKPAYTIRQQLRTAPQPTTYHPQQPPVMYQQMTPSLPKPSMGFQPITKLPPAYDYSAAVAAQLDAADATRGGAAKLASGVQRFSSHYNAKNAEFLRRPRPPATSTGRPVSDILHSLGIAGQAAQTRNRYVSGIDDYYPAESAPKPIVSSYVPQTVNIADLRGLQQSARIKPDAYSSFKPLNIGDEFRVKPEVEGYLTRFGIVKKSKALKKSQKGSGATQEEPTIEESEISTAKVPTRGSNTELAKLLENLQELERLQERPRKPATAARTTSTSTTPRTTTTTRPTTTTTTTTTRAPPTAVPTANLITNGAPLLIEPKKPRRRIDPNFDINFGAASNQHTVQTNTEQLAKLLENLQELEKLKINPENVLKTAAIKPSTTPTPTSASVQLAQGLTNRFSQPAAPAKSTNDAQELELILKQLQQLEQANAAKKSRTTAKPTTRRPSLGSALGVSDFEQLQRLLSDDRELERLFEQAKSSQRAAAISTTPRPTTTTTTKRSNLDLIELQAYLAQLERATSSTAAPSTTTTTTTTTTTSTTTPRPMSDLAQRIGTGFDSDATKSKVQSSNAAAVNHAQFEELINRVQQLERLNSTPKQRQPVATEPPVGYLGFTTRNVKATANDYRVPSHDFALLQQLYQQQPPANGAANYGGIEISTAASAARQSSGTRTTTTTPRHNSAHADELATRIFELTNETGSGGTLHDVDPHDYVQLQKLLSKVHELERVKIKPSQSIGGGSRQVATAAPNLVTAASLRTQDVKSLNGAQIVYAQAPPAASPTKDNLKLDLPVYKSPTLALATHDADKKEYTSSEELRELAMSKPANPQKSVVDTEFEQYQQFFSSLEDSERANSYRNMQPPMIYKTVGAAPATTASTKEPPRFVATKKPPPDASSSSSSTDGKKKNSAKQQQADLEELQKLLYNAQELKKLGVSLPNELSQQLETKLTPTTTTTTTTSTTSTSTTTSTPAPPNMLLLPFAVQTATDNNFAETTVRGTDADSSSPAVFSLTTIRPQMPREPKPTTESTIELPVFSATKIIEAAIKRAANKIGVSTEHTLGFQRRSDDMTANNDDDIMAGANSDDLMAEFSELNYQLALPMDAVTVAPNQRSARENVAIVTPATTSVDLGQNLGELQRLISNLQELQKLNVSLSPARQTDAKYFETLTSQSIATATESKKDRRQSADASAEDATTQATSTTTTTASDEALAVAEATPAPTRIQLDLGIDGDSSSSTTTTEAPSDESRNGSITDLEDSFGPNPINEEPPPPKKKNGFYFLADWNSFLEVGDDDDQVVVRLSPKIGDPRLFLPVKIP